VLATLSINLKYKSEAIFVNIPLNEIRNDPLIHAFIGKQLECAYSSRASSLLFGVLNNTFSTIISKYSCLTVLSLDDFVVLG
jgi:hypothetical protein